MKQFFFKPPVLFYEKLIRDHRHAASFVIFFYFLLSFFGARLRIYLAIKNIVPESLTENIRGVHIHHFAYGIIIISLIGFLALTLPRHYFHLWQLKLAAFFGIGLGLAFDEFGMWLRLKDNYLLRQGYDVMIILSIIFVNIVYFGGLWQRLFRYLLNNS